MTSKRSLNNSWVFSNIQKAKIVDRKTITVSASNRHQYGSDSLLKYQFKILLTTIYIRVPIISYLSIKTLQIYSFFFTQRKFLYFFFLFSLYLMIDVVYLNSSSRIITKKNTVTPQSNGADIINN